MKDFMTGSEALSLALIDRGKRLDYGVLQPQNLGTRDSCDLF